MDFRKAKYIQFVIGLILFIIGCTLFVKEEKLSFVLLGVLLSIDFTVRLFLKIYTNKLISSGQLVKIRQKEYKFWNTVNLIATILIIGMFVHHLLNKEFFFPDKSLIVIMYIAVSSELFFERRGDFYVDSDGFVQPEILKNDYYWSDINDFKLNDNTMSFVIKDKDYCIKITDEAKIKLVNLTSNKE